MRTKEQILADIAEADMVLVGLGEEFDCGCLTDSDQYQEAISVLEEENMLWALPLIRQVLACSDETATQTDKVLHQLKDLLDSKNYFVVSTSFNPLIVQTEWKHGHLVQPCGGWTRKQCGCEGVAELSEEEITAIMKKIQDFPYVDSKTWKERLQAQLGTCPVCGQTYVLNNIYANPYNENGYLSQWNYYMKWLQGTLNKKLVVLELGVGMKYPSVIRFPFEKIAYFNNKATFYRVNHKLYHLSEELKDKGHSIAQNSIDWLSGLC